MSGKSSTFALTNYHPSGRSTTAELSVNQTKVMSSSIKKLLKKAKALHKYIKYDGKVTNLTLSQVQYGGILKGKRIVVTGGGSGIGLAMARKFISEGAGVVITGRNREKLEQAGESINSPRLKTLPWDVSDMSVLSSKIQEAEALLGGIDIFVNNAAFLEHKQTDEAFYDKTMDTNLKAVYFICKEVVNHMIDRNGDKGGKIINISSVNGQMSSTHPYYISKWGLNGLTKGYAKEYAPHNIIVNAIAPGFCASSINYCDVNENAYCGVPLQRIILPEDIAELACFLCSDASNAIVGQIIAVDGGLTL